MKKADLIIGKNYYTTNHFGRTIRVRLDEIRKETPECSSCHRPLRSRTVYWCTNIEDYHHYHEIFYSARALHPVKEDR